MQPTDSETTEAYALVWEAAARWLQPSVSRAYRQGLTGGVARRNGVPPTVTELRLLLLPGLAALGVQAVLEPLPETALEARRGGLRRLPQPLFAFSGPIDTAPPESAEEDTEEEAALLAAWDAQTPTLTQEGLALALESEASVHWQEPHGAEKQADYRTFQASFSHVLLLKRAESKGERRVQIQAALLRWVAYAAAYPERTPTSAPTDAPLRADAAAFLQEIAGQKRDPVSNRLRSAAQHFTQAEIPEAMGMLREALFLQMRLPLAVQTALLTPNSEPLSEVQRRELIYLARAGTRDLKALAARRLTVEARHPEVRRTLEQLRCAPDPWVRASARS